jgi:hypothetical protein
VRSAGEAISQYAGVRGVGFVSIDCAVGMRAASLLRT